MPEQIQGLPAGATVDAQPHDAAITVNQNPTAPIGLPAGATVDPQPHDYLGAGTVTPPSSDQVSIGKDFATGIGKGALKTAVGVGEMINSGAGNQGAAETLAKGRELAEPKGIAQGAGAIGEDMAEWAVGEEGLKSLTSLAKVAHRAPEIMQIIEDYPKASKFIMDTLKAGAIGGAQAGVKAPPGEKIESAEKGAAGGAVAGGAVSLGEIGAEAVGKKSGLLDAPEDKLERAAGGSASVGEHNFEKNARLALPDIATENQLESVKTSKDFAEAAHNSKQKMWTEPGGTGYKDMINRHPKEIISGDDIAKDIKNNVATSVRRHFPKDAAAIDKWADTFKGDYTLEDASQAVVDLNQRLRKFYGGSPSEQFAMATANPELGMLQDAADSMRDKIDAKLTNLGETGAAEKRERYGALAQMQRIFEKRHIVYGRQAPIDIQQTIGAIAAVASGHPAVAAIPVVKKWINSPNRLIKSAIADTAPAGTTKATGSALRTAGKVAKKATEVGAGVTGEKEGQDWIKFKGSDGKQYESHPDDAEKALAADPGAQKQ